MSKYELVAPCNFALEAILSREIKDLGFEVSKVEDGRVTFFADEQGICKANLWLRTAERILLKLAEFEAVTFEELFQNVKKIPFYEYIPKDAEFPVAKASSIKSTLFSTSDIQAIVKKAAVEAMKRKHKLTIFPETGAKYPIHVFANKDRFQIYLDTSGLSLHKRGYRGLSNEAPIKETLAAAMVLLTPWNESRILVDPFCGSGTITIEAALIGMNAAPGLNREFTFQNWHSIPKKMFSSVKEEAESLINKDAEFLIQGYDIDEKALRVARENARIAGVEGRIHYQKRDVRDLSSKDKYGFIITNPPYGERLEDLRSVETLYKDMGKVFKSLDTWSFYIITSHEDFERLFGRRADKKRKLYNGMLKTNYYQFYGPKPPMRSSRESLPDSPAHT